MHYSLNILLNKITRVIGVWRNTCMHFLRTACIIESERKNESFYLLDLYACMVGKNFLQNTLHKYQIYNAIFTSVNSIKVNWLTRVYTPPTPHPKKRKKEMIDTLLKEVAWITHFCSNLSMLIHQNFDPFRLPYLMEEIDCSSRDLLRIVTRVHVTSGRYYKKPVFI